MVLDYDYDANKTSVFDIPYGKYSVSVTNSYDETISASLTVAAGAKGGVDHILTFDMGDDYYYYNGFSQMSLTVNATDHSSVKKPSQTPVDISNYSMRQFESLFYDIGSMLQDNLIDSFPMLGLLYGY